MYCKAFIVGLVDSKTNGNQMRRIRNWSSIWQRTVRLSEEKLGMSKDSFHMPLYYHLGESLYLLALVQVLYVPETKYKNFPETKATLTAQPGAKKSLKIFICLAVH